MEKGKFLFDSRALRLFPYYVIWLNDDDGRKDGRGWAAVTRNYRSIHLNILFCSPFSTANMRNTTILLGFMVMRYALKIFYC